jgi:signal transduction histidine kinase
MLRTNKVTRQSAVLRIVGACRATVVFLLAGLGAFLAPSFAAEPLPRSILVLEQSDSRSPFYGAIYSGLQFEVNASATPPVNIYVESLDLGRFPGPKYEQSLRAHLRAKYENTLIGVIVTVGPNALKYALQWRGELWPGVPIVFAFVDEATLAGLNLPNEVTGRITRLRLQDMVSVAHVAVKGLRRVAIVGDRFETQPVFRHFEEELPAVAAELEVIDLTGLPMAELRKRVAVLPNDTAILYTALFSEGAKVFRRPVDALAMIAEVANRPIIISIETYLDRAGIGGYFTLPANIGKEAAGLALRILDGESPAGIAITTGDSLRPIFDWRELQRWGVSEAGLPPGSEIRNRVLTIWEAYPWEIVGIVAMVLLQSGLIGTLLYERRRRRRAEVEGQQRMAELAHMNRQATVGQLSASIAHELNQPLGAILANTAAAEVILGSQRPKLKEITSIIEDIKRDDLRASEVIVRLRRLLTNKPSETKELDLNEAVREVFIFLSVQAAERNIILKYIPSREAPYVVGDRIQLQQVILNLVMNGMDAMANTIGRKRKITSSTSVVDGGASVEINIADTGSGVPVTTVKRIFEPFFTTKEQGMGMGLSIARTIIEAHGGKIWAENKSEGGALFHVTLPRANTLH